MTPKQPVRPTAGEAAPFHRGELEVQTRAGVREDAARVAPMFRDHMPEPHRRFFAQLPYVVIGLVDERGSPVATVLTGTPGFMHSPTPHRLRLDTRPLPGDPAIPMLRLCADVGLLGIELHTRRRNRVNGTIVELDQRGFTIEVTQSFGNCPQHITQRQHRATAPEASHAPMAATTAPTLDAAAALSISRADTFFLATHHREARDLPSNGADVSHRGGAAGFVRVVDEHTLMWPDYPGNAVFNSLGNLLLNPRAGLLFLGFEDGEVLHISGRGEVVWEGPPLPSMPHVQRWVRFRIDRVVLRPGALAVRWVHRPADPS
jgi:uncharacterized protein